MVNGILAGVLFLVWLWLGFRLGSQVRDKTWKEAVVGVWALSLVLYGLAAQQMMLVCGNTGDLLLTWAWMSMALTLFILGLLLCGLAVIVVIVFCAAALDRAIPEEMRNTVWLGAPGRRVAGLGGALLFLVLCGWFGSRPNPACEGAAVVESKPDIEAIRAILKEQAPELLDDFAQVLE